VRKARERKVRRRKARGRKQEEQASYNKVIVLI
jgi:hypothetical protein